MAYRLLVVPGDNEALRALEEQLGSDVEVLVLNNANDALWEVRNDPPEAIISDVDLPGMSGLDLAEILPNFGVPTKVVLWSREPDPQTQQQATIHGVHHFLSGPISQTDLRNIVYDVLREAQTPSLSASSDHLNDVVSAPTTEVPAPPPTLTPELDRNPTVSNEAVPSEDKTNTRGTPDSKTPWPPQPTRKSTGRRSTGSIVLTADNITPIRNRMSELLDDVGAQCILLTDRAGMVLTEVGKTAELPTIILLPLLSTSFSTAGQISQVLQETESSALYMQEGSHYDLYCFDVLQRYMLVLIFDKVASATKIGTVWVYAKRAIRNMQDMLA
ncbi:MAG: response regulator [Chloroflexi bacterium AL-W]|nr:response regulator [Chloroflexi bacterium AL-N1]NOK64965.1 response regulator [Chloroflexi bacterium AL-N10]NOK76735.1 response regulator [Chloroflexi bacterium AL-N5]NOK84626.1 response regulator [Chloroflexi bacterium AL-W]NOK86549.1 response regulator [Chloroflexi bacterium AL-N15]